MPYKDRNAQRLANRENQRRYRERKRVEKKAEIIPVKGDPIDALVEWSNKTLIVPPGHPLAGQPMAMPEYAIQFLKASWNSHESALSVARKNGKSAICAILVLGYLVGPLRSMGWRGAVCSINREKANELRRQIEAIAESSKLDDLTFRRSPYPGAVESDTGSFEVLSADRSAGHASGFDLVLVDETGLLKEKDRDLLAGLRSSVSAKNGRIMHISIKGDSPLFAEILENPANSVQVHCADDDCDIDDQAQWRKSNPTLGTIKRIEYMIAESERVSNVPGDQASFKAYDLNLPVNPNREMIFNPADLDACFVDVDLVKKTGPCVIGFDFGESSSATAAVVIWPESGWVSCFMAFGDVPNLIERGKSDNANYRTMFDRGELWTYPGRVTPVSRFIQDVADAVRGSRVIAAAADSYKDSEVRDALDLAGLRWPVEFRRFGAGKDGGRDIRIAERLVLNAKLQMKRNLALATAISKSEIRRDSNGNPGLCRAHRRGRIDLVSAFVIACGLAGPMIERPRKRKLRVAIA